MEDQSIFNTLSYKIFYSVAQEYIEKYDADNIGESDIENADENNMPQTEVSNVTPEEPQHTSEVMQFDEPDKTKRNVFIALLVLVVVGAVAWFAFSNGNSKNNPLGVQKPKWEKFVVVDMDGYKFYKEADTSSPNMQVAVEKNAKYAPDVIRLWRGEKAPRKYEVDDCYNVKDEVYPVIDESAGWYKVYIGPGEISEAYIQSSCCREVKPEPITKEIIEKVKTDEGYTHKFVEKGEFANLYIESGRNNEDDSEYVNVGELTEGCIVVPLSCSFAPYKNDVADVDMNNVSETPDSKSWQLTCPESYWKTSPDYESGMFDVTQLKDTDIRKIVMAVRPSGNTDSKVWYYFPTVADDRFIEFEYSFSPAAASEVEEDKAVTKYEVKNDMLMAEINGEMVNTEVDGEMGIDLLGTFDLDGDGSMECAVWVNSGGNIVNPAKVITYDVENDKFVEAGDLEYTEAPTVEDKDGKTVLLQRAGLRWILYAMEDHKLKRVEDEVKMVGSVRNTIEVDNIYGEDEQGDVKITQDFDGDGNDDELTFSRDLSHAGGYGQWMGLNTVVLADGTSHDLGLMAAKFNILNQTTNGMPDIIADNYLYRWDGSGYESYVWDGNNIVKGQ